MTVQARQFLDKAKNSMENTNSPAAKGYYCGVAVTALMFLFNGDDITGEEYSAEYDLFYRLAEELSDETEIEAKIGAIA